MRLRAVTMGDFVGGLEFTDWNRMQGNLCADCGVEIDDQATRCVRCNAIYRERRKAAYRMVPEQVKRLLSLHRCRSQAEQTCAAYERHLERQVATAAREYR